MARLFICLSVAAFLTGGACAASGPNAACVSIETGGVVLQGQVRRELHYGPPGFGEDPKRDARFKIPMLVLDRPIDVCLGTEPGLDDSPLDGIAKIQLVGLPSGVTDGELRVRGTLSRAVSASHFTPVILVVERPVGNGKR
jgi:hypothetical protein